MAILPPNWTKYTTEDGKDYFHNSVTNQTQWELPTDVYSSPAPPPPATVMQPHKQSTQVTKSAGYASNKTENESFISRIPCACCLPGLGFITAGFDVDTADVKSRLLATISIINTTRTFVSSQASNQQTGQLESQASSDISTLFGTKPDLYGPFWIATTAVLTATIAANSSSWLNATHGVTFFADYSLMGTLASCFYSSFALVLGIIWLMSWKISNLNIDLALVCCVYGYSMLPLVLVAFVTPFIFGTLRTVLIFAGFLWSVFICFRLLWLPTAASLSKNARLAVFGVPCLVHVFTYTAFKILSGV